ncbi:MAG: hypothetical protein ACKO7R_06660 [Pseudanabaena sp.]
MLTKAQVIQEIEDTPAFMLKEIFNFIQFMKSKQPQIDFMEFAGIASDAEDIMQEIVEEAEVNRQLDLHRMDSL